ncbi:ATP phosphoribosyltransferase regulatory subunit [Bacillus manliponensis]|uniref:ATP phosphoribosyltransferase regulatory subunit n=1 Tax=Bacillus manliponensis TaxID=574376 RepID=UPI0035133D77
MTKWKGANPNGTRDFLFDECTALETVEQTLRATFIERGYEEIRTPLIEFYDVFCFRNRPIDEEKMYKFFDHKGRILVLRPDMTVPIARVIGTRGMKGPLKLTYAGNVFRANESLSGKYDEVAQVGIEIIGVSNIRAEVECIVSSIQAIRAAGIEDFKIELGQVELYKAIVSKLLLKEVDEEQLRKCIESKNYAALSQFIKEKQLNIEESTVQLLHKLPRLFGGLEVIEEAEQLASHQDIKDAITKLKVIYETIERLGYASYISIDLGMIQYLHYYTGVIFRGYICDIGEEIVSGGRYDKLIGNFGEPIPAVGLAIQIDQLVRAVKAKRFSRKQIDTLIHYSLQHAQHAEQLRLLLEQEEKIVQLSMFDELEETLQFARDTKVKKVVDVSKDIFVEYKWEKDWMIQRKGESPCTISKLR